MRLFLPIYFLLAFAAMAYGAVVTLQWDPNTEPDIKTYRVCWANYSGNTKVFPITNCTTNMHPMTTANVTVDPFSNYYFRVSASNGYASSEWSNVVYVGFQLKSPGQSLRIKTVTVQ